MDELAEVYKKTEPLNETLEAICKDCIAELRASLFGGPNLPLTTAATPIIAEVNGTASPNQPKKRAKCLASLTEEDNENVTKDNSLRKSERNSKLLETSEAVVGEVENEKQATDTVLDTTSKLMPPPPAPAIVTRDVSLARPQRAAKSKTEQLLKEPKLNTKMRRPSKNEEVQVKLEHEHRQSQISDTGTIIAETISSTVSSISEANDSVSILPAKEPSLVVLPSDDDSIVSTQATNAAPLEKEERSEGSLRVRIKREKVSIINDATRKSSSTSPPPPQSAQSAEPLAAEEKVLVPKPIQMKGEPITNVSTLSSTATLTNTTSSSDAVPTTKKTGRKKKETAHRPIKIERFSDLDVASPISSRTRVNRSSKKLEEKPKASSIYEDAVDDSAVPTNERNLIVAPAIEATIDKTEVLDKAKVNATMTLANATMTTGATAGDTTYNMPSNSPANATVATGDATFQVNVTHNPNATVTIGKTDMGDSTFNVPPPQTKASTSDKQHSLSSNKSMQTACDTLQRQDSLMTEDESMEHVEATPQVNTVEKLPPPLPNLPIVSSAKAFMMPTRTHELFNPLLESPVKMRVEAFEFAAQAAADPKSKSTRLKKTKENATPTSLTTPTIGKLQAPQLGRFLTPTQASNVLPLSAAQPKKIPSSASKAQQFPKPITASNLKSTNSTSSKTLSRENSGDDFRKGLHQMAEERKKQREIKHQLAAQQREAKEKERAERMAKLAKEREEKRLKKQMEAEKQKKRELEEINRKLRQQEEAQLLKQTKAKAIQDQERELLLQMKHQQAAVKPKVMLPPPPKNKYTFEMLHEDDSTDDEGKVTHKRPPAPAWSRSHIRGATMRMQQYCPTDVIDCFYSVQPTTPDLKNIFPNIDPRHLKRNSSVLWSTPPRYSELPEY